MKSNTDPIRLLILHGEPIVAAGLRATLSTTSQFRVMAVSTGDGLGTKEADMLCTHAIDVVIADYDRALTLSAGHRQTAAPGSHFPRIVVVTRREKEGEIRRAIEQGVQGYLLAGAHIDELTRTVKVVHRGGRYVSAEAAQCIADSIGFQPLTPRENEVLRLLTEGRCNKSISGSLNIAIGTVKTHVKTILDKLGAESRTEAAAFALQRGLLVEWRFKPTGGIPASASEARMQ